MNGSPFGHGAKNAQSTHHRAFVKPWVSASIYLTFPGVVPAEQARLAQERTMLDFWVSKLVSSTKPNSIGALLAALMNSVRLRQENETEIPLGAPMAGGYMRPDSVIGSHYDEYVKDMFIQESYHGGNTV